MSEPVVGSTLLVQKVTLWSDASQSNAAFSYQLSALSTVTYVNATYALVALSVFDQNQIQLRERNLARSVINTYLAFAPGVVGDMRGTPSSPNFLQAAVLTPDTTSPTLVSFNLSMATGILALSFSEICDKNSFNVLSITFSSPFNTNLAFTLTAGSAYTLQDALIMYVQIHNDDMNAIKLLDQVAISNTTTILSATASLMTDMMGNNFTANAPLAVHTFWADNLPLILTNFSLNLNNSVVSFNFYEVVRLSTFNASSLVFSSVVGGPSVRLCNNSVISSADVDGIKTSVQVSITDLNQIKKVLNLTNIILSVDATSFQDKVGNSMVPVQNMIPIVLAPDVTGPMFLSFTLNVDQSVLRITFDETVHALTFVPNRLMVCGDINCVVGYRLTGGVVSVIDSTWIQVNITDYDINLLKNHLTMARFDNNTFLSLDYATVQDMYISQPNPSFAATLGVIAGGMVRDLTPPSLVSFGFNITSGILVLTFNEFVLATAFYSPAITLQCSNTSIVGCFVSLTEAQAVSGNAKQLFVQLSTKEQFQLKQNYNLDKNASDFYIAFTSGMISDLYGNVVNNIPTTAALRVTEWFNDIINPNLLGFDIDMDAETLTLYFSEPMRVETINFPGITLANVFCPGNITNNTVTLLASSVIYPTSNSTTLVIKLQKANVDRLKLLVIARGTGSTWIQISSATIKDMDAITPNQVNSLLLCSNALPATGFIPDTTPPVLQTVEYSRNSGVFILNFSEPISGASFNISNVILQSVQDLTAWLSEDSHSQLISPPSYVVAVDTLSLVIRLGWDDQNAIKAKYKLYTTVANSYFSATAAAVTDLYGNALTPILYSNALALSAVTPDSTSPVLLAFNLDMNNLAFSQSVLNKTVTLQTAQLTLMFSETVDMTTFNPTKITLQSSQTISDPTTESVTLTGLHQMLSTANTTSIVFKLLPADADRMKALLVGVTQSWSFVGLNNGVVKDMSGNLCTSLVNGNAIAVASYTPDVTPPNLLEFSLNMNTLNIQLTMLFDETVNGASLFPNVITLRNAVLAQNATASLLLTGAYGMSANGNMALWVPSGLTENFPYENSNKVTITLLPLNTNELKRLLICDERSYCWFIYTAQLVHDVNNNWIVGCY